MESTSVPLAGSPARQVPKRLLRLRSDDHLVDRVRGGDGGAFEVLFERHSPGILSFCRHMLGTLEEAEDAVQQVFTSAHRELVSGSGELRIKPWLYTVARNRCLSMLRARRETVASDAFELSTSGFAESVEGRADLRELLADLHDLPDDQRAALVLTELEDLSQAEVARVLDIEVRKVKGLVFRARAGLTERREARGADCAEIREELSTAQRGAFRRGRLRHHLKACEGCSAYLAEVRRQRAAMALVLPVLPTLGLKESVLAATGIGGAAGGGGAAAGGGLAAALTAAAPGAGATIAKVAAVAALAGSAGVAGGAVLDSRDGAPPSGAPAVAPARGDLPAPAWGAEPATGAPATPGERSASGRGALGRERGGSRGKKVRHRGAAAPRGAAKTKIKVRGGPEKTVARPVRKPKPERTKPVRPAPVKPVKPAPTLAPAPLEQEVAPAPVPAPVKEKGAKLEE